MLLLLPYACVFCVVVLLGGKGRAKGFGGPWAPALSSALALGDGGGSTTPDEWLVSETFAGVSPAVPPDWLGEGPAVALPPSSDCSLGICTLSLGLLPSPPPKDATD